MGELKGERKGERNQDTVKVKVAFVANLYRFFEAFCLPLIRLLQERGVEVHAYARPDQSRAKLIEQGVICHDFSLERNPFKLANWRALQELTQSFREEGYRLVHVHTPVAALLGRIAAKRARVPWVMYTAHGFHFFKGAPLHFWLLYYPLEYWMARWTDQLITINQEDARRGDSLPLRGRSAYIPGVGVDTAAFRLTAPHWHRAVKRESLGIADDEFVILCVAELNGNKNQAQLIDAVRLLVDQGKKVRCLLVGHGALERTYRERVRALQVEEHVHLLGFRRDIAELLTAADAVTLLSKREGLPFALIEAMAAGKPIVATAIRGHRDLIADGENGYLVPVGDVRRTAEAFAVLQARPQLCAAMGRHAQRMAAQYDVSLIVHKMERFYAQGLQMKPEGRWERAEGEGGLRCGAGV